MHFSVKNPDEELPKIIRILSKSGHHIQSIESNFGDFVDFDVGDVGAHFNIDVDVDVDIEIGVHVDVKLEENLDLDMDV